ncbi:hypothetical protein BJ912DRAFT_981195 [Pholiota molesta]|nr:hypothetical protein BJ912DRAFT_981195 [Pholiota molesta]
MFFNDWLRGSSGSDVQFAELALSEPAPPPIRPPSYDTTIYTAATHLGNTSDDAAPYKVAKPFADIHDCLNEEAIGNHNHTADPVARPNVSIWSSGEALGLRNPQTAMDQRPIANRGGESPTREDGERVSASKRKWDSDSDDTPSTSPEVIRDAKRVCRDGAPKQGSQAREGCAPSGATGAVAHINPAGSSRRPQLQAPSRKDEKAEPKEKTRKPFEYHWEGTIVKKMKKGGECLSFSLKGMEKTTVAVQKGKLSRR